MQPSISVVVGSSAQCASLEACLEALEPQMNGVDETLVYEAAPSDHAFRERFAWAQFVDRPGALVPELWRDGIDESRKEVVALTIAQMIPAPDWIETIREQHGRFHALGGAIEPAGRGMRLVDWAEYFCRYARDMLPFEGRESLDLPGDNAAYTRELLEQHRDVYRDGFWEPDVHRALADDGVVCWHSPELVVSQWRSYGWRAFVRQRLAHGRAYGHQRGVRFSRMRNLAGVLGSPLVPFLMTARVFRQVAVKRRRRLRALAAVPVMLTFNVAWAVAEARGHLDMLVRR